MIDLFELYFYEDCPYQDESAELLNLEGRGKMRIFREKTGPVPAQATWQNIMKEKT